MNKTPDNEQNMNTADTEQPWQPKPIRKATYKQRKLAELVATTPMTNREAYRQVYDAEGMKDTSIDVEVARTLRKPAVAIELAKYNDTARLALLEVVEESRKRMKQSSDRDGSAWAKVLQSTGDSILDRTEGKATQRLEVQSTAVTLNLSLSDLIDTQANRGDTDSAQ